MVVDVKHFSLSKYITLKLIKNIHKCWKVDHQMICNIKRTERESRFIYRHVIN